MTQALIERWARAVREENREGIRADHDSEIIDVRCTTSILIARAGCLHGFVGNVLLASRKPVAFDFHDVKIAAGIDVGFATATGRCVDIDPEGKREELEFRLTMCLRKIDGR